MVIEFEFHLEPGSLFYRFPDLGISFLKKNGPTRSFSQNQDYRTARMVLTFKFRAIETKPLCMLTRFPIPKPFSPAFVDCHFLPLYL